jgi:hypothetical protein
MTKIRNSVRAMTQLVEDRANVLPRFASTKAPELGRVVRHLQVRQLVDERVLFDSRM